MQIFGGVRAGGGFNLAGSGIVQGQGVRLVTPVQTDAGNVDGGGISEV